MTDPAIGDRVYERDQNSDRVGTISHILEPNTRGQVYIRVVFPTAPDEWVDAGIMERAK